MHESDGDMTLQEAIALGLVPTASSEPATSGTSSTPQFLPGETAPRPKSAFLTKLKLSRPSRRSVVDSEPCPAKGPLSPRISGSSLHSTSSRSESGGHSVHPTHSPPVGVSFFLTDDGAGAGADTHPILPTMVDGGGSTPPRQRTGSGLSLARRMSWKRGVVREAVAEHPTAERDEQLPDSPVLGGEKRRRRVESLGPWVGRGAIGAIKEEEEGEPDDESCALGRSVIQVDAHEAAPLVVKIGTPKYEAPEVWVHPPDDGKFEGPTETPCRLADQAFS